jgi:murein DD-endopeptidase MepM/ murein hydrolase activator NlpD
MSRTGCFIRSLVALYLQTYGRITKSIHMKKKLTWYLSSFFKHGYEDKALYLGFSMLTLSTVLLVGILIGLEQDNWSAVLGKKQPKDKQEFPMDYVAVNTAEVVPQSAAATLPQVVEKEKVLHAPTVFHPVQGPIKIDFGWQLHPLYKEWRYHAGVDIEGVKDQSVLAICSGEITDIVQDKHMGLAVVVQNNDYKVYYGSLSEAAVSKGSHVDMGQKIGKMGIFDGEPYYHVHLAIKKGEQAIDPKTVCSKE